MCVRHCIFGQFFRNFRRQLFSHRINGGLINLLISNFVCCLIVSSLSVSDKTSLLKFRSLLLLVFFLFGGGLHTVCVCKLKARVCVCVTHTHGGGSKTSKKINGPDLDGSVVVESEVKWWVSAWQLKTRFLPLIQFWSRKMCSNQLRVDMFYMDSIFKILKN